MRIDVDLEELLACKGCGIVFDCSRVAHAKPQFEHDTTRRFICPLCKHVTGMPE